MNTTYTANREKFISKFPSVKDYIDLENKVWIGSYPNEIGFAEKVSNTYNRYKLKKEFPFDDVWDMDFYKIFGSAIYSNEEFTTKLDKMIIATQEMNKAKLLNALQSKLQGLPISSVNEIKSKLSAQGIQGEFSLTLENGTEGIFKTKSIYAGGYNIQCLHYRYLMRLDKALEAQKTPETISMPEELNSLKTKITEFKNASEAHPNDFIMLTPEVIHFADSMKGQSRNFSWFVKNGFLVKREHGNYYIKRYKYYITNKGKLFFS
jgi:hypothetical protein